MSMRHNAYYVIFTEEPDFIADCYFLRIMMKLGSPLEKIAEYGLSILFQSKSASFRVPKEEDE